MFGKIEPKLTLNERMVNYNNNITKLATLIKQKKELYHISTSKLAEKVGVSTSCIERFLGHRTQPHIIVIASIISTLEQMHEANTKS